MTINEKLEAARAEMRRRDVDAVIIPSSDPHQSEYVADHWKCRTWISAFNGSAGTAVVTMDHAGLWTDSRYFLQAEEELADSAFVLHKMYNQFSPSYTQWLCEQLPANSRVAVDGRLFSKSQFDQFEKRFADYGITIDHDIDIVGAIWTANRSPLPSQPIYQHDLKYAGRSRTEKLGDIRRQMISNRCDYHFVSTLDDIAWIFNIRGADVEFNPVAIAYALIGTQDVVLFVDPRKISDDMRQNLELDSIRCVDYEEAEGHLNRLDESASIYVDPGDCSVRFYRAINCRTIRHGRTISRGLKARKNDTEIGHVKHVMVKDGVALCRLYRWLDQTLDARPVSEAELADKLAEFRSQQDGYVGESFSAIVGYQSNGAIVHYRPEHGRCADITKEGLLLVDSGGQYLDGTTDITRTTALGNPTSKQKRRFTLVLKGHIALAMATYPRGTIGGQLDVLARKYLWDDGLNYLHGTGHGVGFFLNVHEPPQGFTAGLSSRSNTILEPGMLTSNEPGYYEEGAYGIRIENLVFTVEADRPGFLAHDTVTLFPIDQNLIDSSLLDDDERRWLNNYHAQVYDQLAPHLNDDERIWLQEKCASL